MPINWTPMDLNFGRLGNRMFQLAYVYGQVRRGEIPDVWVQDPKYFDAYRREIQQLFGRQIEPREEVSIHVRRGDYVNHPMFVNLAEKTVYYERAMALFPDRRFLVFSDDPDWCASHFAGRASIAARGADEWEDMMRMASCRDHIIANSSFSWWAAYLDPQPQKRVIYPSAWHTDGVQRIAFPPDWTCL